MNCPNCQTALNASRDADLHFLICPSCRGLWLEYDELRQADEAVHQDAAWFDFEIWSHEDRFKFGADIRLCPACQVPMACLAYGDAEVEADVCTSCRGIWLDQGELGRIIHCLIEQAAAMDLPDTLRAALQEARGWADGSEPLAAEWKDLGSLLRLLQVRLFNGQPRLMQAVLAMQLMRRRE